MPDLTALFVSDYEELRLELERLRMGGRAPTADPQLAVFRQRVEELEKEAETPCRRCAELEQDHAQFVREHSALERQRDELRLELVRLRKEGREPSPDPQLAVLRQLVQELDKEVETLRRRCAESSSLEKELNRALIRLQETASELDKAKDDNFLLRKQLMDCQKRLYTR